MAGRRGQRRNHRRRRAHVGPRTVDRPAAYRAAAGRTQPHPGHRRHRAVRSGRMTPTKRGELSWRAHAVRRAGDAASGRCARGFTLVEVLVAVAVVAITLAAGLKAAGALTDNAQRLSEVVNAQWCADNALTNLRLNKQ